MANPEITRKRMWLRRSLYVFAALLAGAVAAGVSGLPQKRIVEWAIERNFGMIAEVEWGGAVPDLRIKRVYLFHSAEAQEKRQPLVSAFDIRTQYHLLASGRKIEKLKVGKLLIDLDPDDPALRELPFLKSEAMKQAGPADPTFIPQEIEIDGAAIRLHRVDGTFALGDEFGVRIDLANPQSAAFKVGAQAQRFVLDSGDVHVRLSEVTLDGSGRYEGGNLTWSQTVEDRGVFRVAFDVNGPLAGDDAHLDVSVGEASFKGDGLPAFLESIAAPIRFAEFTLESATARVSLATRAAANLTAAARVYAPGLPGAAEPLYRDAIRIRLTAENADTLNAEATVAFAQGQSARATLRGDADQGEVSAQIAGWSRTQFVDALPVAFRESVSGLGFDSFSSDAAVKWTKTAYEVKAHAESQGGGADAAPILWAVQAHGARDGSQGLEGTAEARLGDRRIRASARYESAEHYLAEAVIEEVKIAPWIRLFAGRDAAAPFGGTMEGMVLAEAKGKDAPLEIRPDLRLKNFAYDALELDEITAKGSLRYAQAEGRVTVDEVRAEAPDGLTAAVLSGWDYNVNTRTGGGAFTLSADLGIVARLVGDTALYGAGATEGRARIEGTKVDADFSFSSNNLNYGDLQMPYATKLTGAGALSYDRRTRRGVLSAWHAAIGEGTTLRLGDTKFSTGPFAAEGELVSESDLQVLVAMDWLESVQGSMSERSKIRYLNDVLHVDWDLRIAAPKMELEGHAGSAESVEFEAAGTYEGGLTGTGRVRAGKITAAGGSIVEASGPVLFDGELMRIQQAKGELFRGAVRADIDVGVLKENFPIVLSGTFEDVDLAIFSDEVKPPKTQLTGTARGAISVEYGLKGLSAFTFEAEAPAGVSMNRSLVEELLQSDKFLSGAGANVAEKAMDKLLGTAPQRPFDRGRLNVQLAEKKITGLAVLESEKTPEYNGLNLRVTLDMDQSALAEALKMLQESAISTVN
jgi:hypothetical protein